MGRVEATLGSMGLGWGQWDSVEIVKGQLGVSGGQWCSVGAFRARWGSLELSGRTVGPSGESVVLSGAQWGSVRNVYTPFEPRGHKT